MSQRYAIIMAAGKGTRMKSKLPKVMHPVAGVPMVGHVIEEARKAGADHIVTVVGHGADLVKEYLGERSDYALQTEQLGTAHAVMQAAPQLEGKSGTTIVLSGDMPLFTSSSIEAAFKYHEEEGASATVISARVDDPTGYGRVVRSATGHLERIVEEKDASEEERKIQEINTGTYFFDNQALFEALKKVGNDNAQGEYYLPDVIEILKAEEKKVGAFPLADSQEALGVNDRKALSQAEEVMRRRINDYHLANGVTLLNPETTYIDASVVIGQDTTLEGGVVLKGQTTLGEDCYIQAGSRIEDSTLADRVLVKASTIEEATVEDGVNIGPHSHLRPGTHLGEDVHIGNFVEVKNASLGKGTKAGHLSYIGDATVGEDVNFGAGSIIVNYDGHKKHHTTIGSGSFIGCNVNIVSPVNIEENAFLGAGSTVTKDVEADALVIERAEEVVIPGYVSRVKEKWAEEDRSSEENK